MMEEVARVFGIIFINYFYILISIILKISVFN